MLFSIEDLVLCCGFTRSWPTNLETHALLYILHEVLPTDLGTPSLLYILQGTGLLVGYKEES